MRWKSIKADARKIRDWKSSLGMLMRPSPPEPAPLDWQPFVTIFLFEKMWPFLVIESFTMEADFALQLLALGVAHIRGS
jgi:hypothetical protein